ncbi:MAG TPA: hypothetical protein VER55_00180 [Ardenticatenaceae bacterium]|nr:hypothetical protein [Ardenticatenaceae bacterium]
MPYHPTRQKTPRPTGAPLEIDLVFNVRPCGTCTYFWPDDPSQQPYGPYPAFDFGPGKLPDPETDQIVVSFPWTVGTTRPAAFPNPEVVDGCRKAPIMTIGINPNLTAFAPNRTGASWCYPSFYTDDGGDEWTKYAYYYRYRSVYQERFDLDFIRPYLLPEPRVVAPRPGVVTAGVRTSDSPSFELHVCYDGDDADTVIPLVAERGSPRWVVLFDSHPPNHRFAAGDVLAARLDVPPGQTAQIYRDQVGYYEQFVPVLTGFEALLRQRGYTGRPLLIGEDVCQLDMVACASPHWTPDYLGGKSSEQDIVDNCVVENAWAMKQVVQTQPAVLYLVGEASYNMFRATFGALIDRDPPLSHSPADGAFTLLRESTDADHPCYFRFSTVIDGTPYNLETRLVITPHFSYSTNFAPQFRLSPQQWQTLQAQDPTCADFLQHDARLTYVQPEQPRDYAAVLVKHDAPGVLADIGRLYPAQAAELEAAFYDPHAMMGSVLSDLVDQGTLGYGPAVDGSGDVLTRTTGSCHFCVNSFWQFPLGCPYGKPNEPPPAAGYLEQVAAALVAAGHGGQA